MFKLAALLLRENLKYALITISILCIGVFVYFKFFSGINLIQNYLMLEWMGGSVQSVSFITITVRLSCLLAVFMFCGKIIERLMQTFSCYLLPRFGSKRKMIYMFLFQTICFAVFFMLILHGLFLIFYSYFAPQQLNYILYFVYFALDVMSVVVMLVIYFILEVIFHLEKSLLCIIAICLMNSIFPYPLPIATSLAKIGGLYQSAQIQNFVLLAIVCNVTLMFSAIILIGKKKEINIC